MILILDCGSQLTQNIARRIRKLGVYAEIHPHNVALSQVEDVEGIIISGGPQSIYDEFSPAIHSSILEKELPIFGICYGMHLLASMLGCSVKRASIREYGQTYIYNAKGELFYNISSNFQVWMSHADVVEELAEGCIATAVSDHHLAAFENVEKRMYGVQFHPEVDHTQYGNVILDNFLHICGAEKTWSYDRIREDVQEIIVSSTTGKIGVGGVSGGIDSTLAAYLVSQECGKNFHPIFIDNGLLREGEAQDVSSRLEQLGMTVLFVDAREEFLKALTGVTHPDDKRRIIGHKFIEVFEREAGNIPGVSYLLQGTLYPDVIESTGIKRHHNVGGLPEKMNLKVVEPFRFLFKDEIREMAINNSPLKYEDIYRHPFPGPGLAVRIAGEITPKKLAILRKADYIYIEELRKRNLYYNISQAGAILTNADSVGVMGDGHSTASVIALRAVVTTDFMTADWYDFQKEDLQAIANRIINEVPGVNRVVYDVTQKPPGTIEWY